MNNDIISIKDNISPNLSIRKNAINFFETKINNVLLNDIKIDFAEVKSISYSFAHQYITSKRKSGKNIVEINIPDNIHKIMEIAENSLDGRNKIGYLEVNEEIPIEKWLC